MRLLAVVLMLGVLTACGASQPDGSQTGHASYAENGVSVEMNVAVDANGSGIVAAKFIPDNEDWHLYDSAMSLDGVDGFGRPTRLDVTDGASEPGPTTADVEAYELFIESLDIELPVYPDGPVTLRTPFTSTDSFIDVSLTYMSCGSGGGCTTPVVARTVRIDLTQAE